MSSRDSMETLASGDPDTIIKILDGRSDTKRKELERKVKYLSLQEYFHSIKMVKFC